MSSADALIYSPVEPCRKPGRSMSTCMPTSSYEALRYAVAALNRLDDFYCEKIGAGFFSEVFKVRHRVTGQVMVLKMNTSQSNRANSLREVQLMNRLSHHNILKFMGVCVHEGQLHALTEFINGGSLEQLLQDRTRTVDLSWEKRIKLSLDIACGMEYLHSRGVFHRDLTSKNVLIKIHAEEMTAVVGDFGLAEKIPDSRDRSQRLPIVGSPYWMAPECLKGKWYNEKADVFSYGIILCEIIARIEADPDVLPRTENFGVDYVAFSEMCPECPPQFLELAFSSCRIDPDCRPNFKDIVCQLEKLLNIISSMSGGLHLSYAPVAYASCWDDGDSIDNVRAIFAHGWTRSNISQSRTELKNQSPEKDSSLSQISQSVPVTPKHIGEAMSMQDPHYKPNNSSQNPFATLPRFWKGKKFLEQSASFTNIDLNYSINFNLPSPCQDPVLIRDAINPLKHKKVSKSLPTSPVLHKKDFFESSFVSSRSISPGPSFSPPSSLSPFEADESFSGYNSVQEQMSDCKLEDSNFHQENKINPNSTCDVPIMVNLGTKTPSFCVKLRRSSGESGFFSVGDRNSACDLILEQINDSKVEDTLCQAEAHKNPNTFIPHTDINFRSKTFGAKLRRSSGESGFFSVEDPSSACDLSLESCHNSEDMSLWTSDNILDLQPNQFLNTVDGRRRKRPSSCCSDEICSCCRVLPHNANLDSSDLLQEQGFKTGSSNSLLPNHNETNLEEVDYECHMYDSSSSNNLMEPLRQKEISSQIKSDVEFSCTNFSTSKTCKKGNRLAKCMRTSPDV